MCLGENKQVIAICVCLYGAHFFRLCQPKGTIGQYGYCLTTFNGVCAAQLIGSPYLIPGVQSMSHMSLQM